MYIKLVFYKNMWIKGCAIAKNMLIQRFFLKTYILVPEVFPRNMWIQRVFPKNMCIQWMFNKHMCIQ